MVAVVGLSQTLADGVPTVVRTATLIDASAVDYLILATYFVFVLGIGLIARRSVSDRSTSSSPGARCPRG